LKLKDIDIPRKLIHIRGAKGRKDMYTMLSDPTMETLRDYQKSKNYFGIKFQKPLKYILM